MSDSPKELLLAIKRIYDEVLESDEVVELYLSREKKLNELYLKLQSYKIDANFRELLYEVNQLNQTLIKRITAERESLRQERKTYEKQKTALEQYSYSVGQNESYFIDKKR
ncbi:hypothetical protein [Paenibacillus sp. DYY-L-2]|uniref:hypothetical protein n=1 Tax=Paenibacillus sp. DYY-L-2 TaxID=3447013 RepID=UPI003F4FFCF5